MTESRPTSSSQPDAAQPPSITLKVGIGVGAGLGGLVIVILLSVFLVIWRKQRHWKQAVPQRKLRDRYTPISAPQTIPSFPPKNGIRAYQKPPTELAACSMPYSGQVYRSREGQQNPIELDSCSTPKRPRAIRVREYQRDPLEPTSRSMQTSPKEIGSSTSPGMWP